MGGQAILIFDLPFLTNISNVDRIQMKQFIESHKSILWSSRICKGQIDPIPTDLKLYGRINGLVNNGKSIKHLRFVYRHARDPFLKRPTIIIDGQGSYITSDNFDYKIILDNYKQRDVMCAYYDYSRLFNDINKHVLEWDTKTDETSLYEARLF